MDVKSVKESARQIFAVHLQVALWKPKIDGESEEEYRSRTIDCIEKALASSVGLAVALERCCDSICKHESEPAT